MRYGIFLTLLLGLLCIAAAKKSGKASLQVFPEASSTDGKFAAPMTLLHSGKKTQISLMPLATEKDVEAFYPFDAGDGSSGAYFRLGPHGSNLLEQFTMSSRGSYLVVVVNGRHVADLLVDGPVHDSILVVPAGLLPSDIMAFAASYRIIGQSASESARRTKEIQKTLEEILKAEEEKSKPVKSVEPKRTKKPPRAPKRQKSSE